MGDCKNSEQAGGGGDGDFCFKHNERKEELIFLENPLWAKYRARWVNSGNLHDSLRRSVMYLHLPCGSLRLREVDWALDQNAGTDPFLPGSFKESALMCVK